MGCRGTETLSSGRGTETLGSGGRLASAGAIARLWKVVDSDLTLVGDGKGSRSAALGCGRAASGVGRAITGANGLGVSIAGGNGDGARGLIGSRGWSR